MLIIKDEFVAYFKHVLNSDKEEGRKKVLYEWHFAAKQINAIDEGESYRVWERQLHNNGFKLKNTKTVKFEGFILKRLTFSSENNSIGGTDPLAFATGYIKADNEWIVFEANLNP
jgi:hypothetical protein